MRAVALFGLALLAACATAATNDAMGALTGTYTHRFANHMVEGEQYQSEDRLDIVRIDATHAAVSVGLEFMNGHSCAIEDDATLEGDALVLHPTPDNDGLAACELHVVREGDAMVFHDPGNGCVMHYCGMRGRFEGATLPYASRKAPPSLARVRGRPAP